MKTLAFTFALTLISILGFSQDAKNTTITVTIDQIKNNKGHILLGLHTIDTFMKADAIQKAKSEIKDGKIVATFVDVQPGTYAIMALHDENDNAQMDFESNGMPKETYAVSNNPSSFGPPQFSDAKFVVTDEHLELNMQLK